MKNNNYRLSSSLVTIKKQSITNKYEVLMLKRANTTSFANAYVFPGGIVDKIDNNIYIWSNFKLSKLYSNNEDIPLLSLKLTAIRETFEETGILVSSPMLTLTNDEVKQWREKLELDSSAFPQLFKQYNIIPDIDNLHYISDWEPTKLNPKNHHVYLFAYFTDNNLNYYNPNTVGSTREVESIEYNTTEAWLNKLNDNNNDFILLPPQLYTLLILNNYFSTYTNLKSYLKSNNNNIQLGKMRSKFELIDINNEEGTYINEISKHCKLIVIHYYNGDWEYNLISNDNDNDNENNNNSDKLNFLNKNFDINNTRGGRVYHRILSIVNGSSLRSIKLITNLNQLNPGLLVLSNSQNKL